MTEKKPKDFAVQSTLRVQDGIEQPAQVNVSAVGHFKRSRKKLLTAREYYEAICSGNRSLLSQAITLIESALPAHQELAQQVIALCLPLTGKSLRIGITGVPGVGKSTFIEAFGQYLTGLGHKVAVLAIDPSSQRSRGSILGDKTRMAGLAADDNAFIRPSPTAGTLGGVARKTQESLYLCEAAGFNIIIIETVGVGQSETAVHAMVDFFMLLMLPGAGDELQGIKRGIMEMADAILVNKADGEQSGLATLAKAQYQNALHLFPPIGSGWTPVVGTCSALFNIGIEDAWKIVCNYKETTTSSGYFAGKRIEQSQGAMYRSIEEGLLQRFYQDPRIKALIDELEKQLSDYTITSYLAAQKLLEAYYGSRRSPVGSQQF